MTRRKAAALGNAKSTTSATSASAKTKDTFTTNEIATLPELTRTLGGNVELELGDENVDDNVLAAMLEQYNNSLPPQTNSPAAAMIIQAKPPVIYDELTEEAQNDSNFYSSMHDFDPFMTDDEFNAELNQWEFDPVTKENMLAFTTQYDQQQESTYFDAELRRTSEEA